jgi:hypothetical protein
MDLCGESFKKCALINHDPLNRTKNEMRMNMSGDFFISNFVQFV